MFTLPFGVCVEVGNRIMNVKDRGRYDGRQEVGCSQRMQDLYQFYIPAHFSVSSLVPYQQAFGGPAFWLLLLNARSVCKKSHIVI